MTDIRNILLIEMQDFRFRWCNFPNGTNFKEHVYLLNQETHVFVSSVPVVKGSVPLSGRQAAGSGGHILTVGVSL